MNCQLHYTEAMSETNKESPDDRAAKARHYMDISGPRHRFYGGKMETVPRCRVGSMQDFSVWYSPGVAQPCLDIKDNPDLVYEYTSKWNTVAVVSDGSRVLGLGDIGPKAGLPVMEGKAMLYKYLGGVDSVPLMLDTQDPDEIIKIVLAVQPTYGGINLEDLSQPKCFRILDELREKAEIPVWHDDQQGTATVTLAGLLSALKIMGKNIGDVKIAFIGAGAANIACARLIFARGADPSRCYMVDIGGLLGKHRSDVEARKDEFRDLWKFCTITNAEGRRGGIPEALRHCDVLISYSSPGPGTIKPEWISTMAKDPIVFACANPVPEIWPWEAKEAGAAIVATGRSDFPNQVNNSLCFPGIFRGTLDVRARTISDGMCFAAADALLRCGEAGAGPDKLLPSMEDWEIVPHIAASVGIRAQEEGLARIAMSYEELYQKADFLVRRSRNMTHAMMEQGFIEKLPPELE